MEKNTELIVVGGSPLEEGNCLSCFLLWTSRKCAEIFSLSVPWPTLLSVVCEKST